MSGGRYNGRLDGLQLPGITGQDHLRAAFLSQADQVGQVGAGIIEDSSISSRVSSLISSGLRPPRWPGRWPRDWVAL